MQTGVYGIYHIPSEQWYIGAAKDIQKRIDTHSLFKQIAKQECTVHILEVVTTMDTRTLHYRELFWIKIFKEQGILNKVVAGYPVRRPDLTAFYKQLRNATKVKRVPVVYKKARGIRTKQPKTSMKERLVAMQKRNEIYEVTT